MFQRKLDETTKLLRELQEAQNERLSTRPPPNMICLLGPSYREMHLGMWYLVESEPPGQPRNTGVGSLSLLQGIFRTQEWKRALLHCRQVLYHLSYQGSPLFMEEQQQNQKQTLKNLFWLTLDLSTKST